MSLTAQIQLSILAHETSSGDISRTLRATPVSYALSLTDGTGANQAQVAWSDKGTLTPGQSLQIHSSDGMAGFADERGSVNFSAIKVIYYKNTGSTTNVLVFQDWATGNPFGAGEISIRENAAVCLISASATGFATTGGTLRVENLGVSSPASYEIVLIGEGTIT